MGSSVGAEDKTAAVQVARLVPRHRLRIVLLGLASRRESPADAGAVQTLHQLSKGQLFQCLHLQPGGTMAQGSDQFVAPIEPETTAIRQRAGSDVEDCRNALTFQFGRDFGEVAALPVVEGQKTKRASGRPRQTLRKFLQADEVKSPTKHFDMAARLLSRERVLVEDHASALHLPDKCQQKGCSAFKHPNSLPRDEGRIVGESDEYFRCDSARPERGSPWLAWAEQELPGPAVTSVDLLASSPAKNLSA